MNNKIILFVMILLVGFICCSCKNRSIGDFTKVEDKGKRNIIKFIEIEQSITGWDQNEISVKLENDVIELIGPIISNQDAVEMGLRILDKRHEFGKLTDFTLIAIVHSTIDDVWRFEYSKDQAEIAPDSLVECGSFYIAIDVNAGRLIKAWIEE